MTRELTHEEAFVVLDAAALDALESVERDAVLAHAAACAICAAELAQLRETAAYLAFASPATADAAAPGRERIHSRLMARAAADLGSSLGEVRSVEVPVRRLIGALAWRRAEWMAIAAGVVAVVSASFLAMSYREREDLRAQLAARDSMIAGVTGKNVAMMTLMSNEAKAPMGHMFWDKSRNMWTLVAHDMPELKPGRTYQLWLVTANAKINAGTFEAKHGEAMMQKMYPLPPDQLMEVAVTDEPMGGMPQPTGAMVMSAQAH